MTNRSRLWRFMERELLPAWGLTIAATWLWLKVTNYGEPVSPLVCFQSVIVMLPPSKFRRLLTVLVAQHGMTAPDDFAIAAAREQCARQAA